MDILFKIREWLWNRKQPNVTYWPVKKWGPRPMNKYDEDFRDLENE